MSKPAKRTNSRTERTSVALTRHERNVEMVHEDAKERREIKDELAEECRRALEREDRQPR